MKLDGTDKITSTPYDAHEQVVRVAHEHVLGEGYKVKIVEVEKPKEKKEK